MSTEFDLTLFETAFPPEEFEATLEEAYDIVTIASPFSIIAVETLRARLGMNALEGKVAADVFLFARGEADVRHATKIGGLPYRPAKSLWPTYRSQKSMQAEPYTFLAQFDFSGSKDIVGDLPGDVLALFARDETYRSRDSIVWEWWPADIPKSELMSAAAVPPQPMKIPTLAGLRHRTTDFMTCKADLPDDFFVYQHMTRIRGMKIGGLPSIEATESRGRYICQLAAVGPIHGMRYPWCNVLNPVTFKDAGRESLDLIDNGLLAIYIEESGNLDWAFEYA